MALVKQELSVLHNFMPSEAVDMAIEYLHLYKIHLKIKRERKTILGDYRPSHKGKPHTISVNANLNKYHFLITFIHEVAHLQTYVNYSSRVSPHGKEWKHTFAQLLQQFIDKNIFPTDIQQALAVSFSNLAASTCSDPHLFKVLYKYDEQNGKVLVSHLQIGEVFSIENGEKYMIKEKRRTRFACIHLSTKKLFLFPGIYEVFKE